MRVLVLLLFASLVGNATASDLVVEALLPGIAVLKIDGIRTTLREGETQQGVRLISADARTAVVEIGGRQQQLQVSQRISGQFTKPEERSVRVARNEQMQYRTTAEINGVRLPVIVDTGANVVAMNSAHAERMGIDDEEGIPSQVQTAGSVVPARSVTLDTVSVGGIRIDSVDATVIDGPHPAVILLGMSYLQHVNLEERDGVLTLRARW